MLPGRLLTFLLGKLPYSSIEEAQTTLCDFFLKMVDTTIVWLEKVVDKKEGRKCDKWSKYIVQNSLRNNKIEGRVN